MTRTSIQAKMSKIDWVYLFDFKDQGPSTQQASSTVLLLTDSNPSIPRAASWKFSHITFTTGSSTRPTATPKFH